MGTALVAIITGTILTILGVFSTLAVEQDEKKYCIVASIVGFILFLTGFIPLVILPCWR